MSIEILEKVTKGEEAQTVQKMFDSIAQQAVGLKYTDTVPTSATVPYGKLTIYSDGAGVKRVYFRTGQNEIGYVILT